MCEEVDILDEHSCLEQNANAVDRAFCLSVEDVIRVHDLGWTQSVGKLALTIGAIGVYMTVFEVVVYRATANLSAALILTYVMLLLAARIGPLSA